MRFRLLEHEIVDSTSERAFAAIAAGDARHGDVHLARGQTSGRGRRGARWESAPDQGLYASVILRPEPPAPPAAVLTMTAGLAVLDAVRSLGVERSRLKWPNDVLVGSAKLAGILVETRGFDPRTPHFVVGIGVNVAQARFPDELAREREVISLAMLGVVTDPAQLLEGLLARLAERWQEARERPLELARDFLEATGLAGRRVRVVMAGASVEGRAIELDPGRGLRVVRAGGEIELLPIEHVRAVEGI